ncbi:HAD-IIIC family phosphatase [Deferribacterales bacterium RsTz2092]|nr:methoxymalonyl-ACP biosynthesis protein FkbH [Deferribacterales bacterium]
MFHGQYPFDADELIKKRKSILRGLRSQAGAGIFIEKKVAILGGSTTASIKELLEIFLLTNGILPIFYESEYAQYWQTAMFSEDLPAFKPDIIFIHTTFRNITELPAMGDSGVDIDNKLEKQFNHFKTMWERLANACRCPIIQNNFERPIWRLMGNSDVSDVHGASNFVSRLNQCFYKYAQAGKNFYINDIDYLSASFGLASWHDNSAWYMFKCAMAVSAMPELAFSVANIIKSIYGKNKKAFVLDLDDTLWGGVIGDDGVNGILVGEDNAAGEGYSEFQRYIKAHKDLGILLNIASKNDENNAMLGLNHPDGVLKSDDFAVIKANWDSKDINVRAIASTLNIGLDSLVFIDDNPAERMLVKENVTTVAVPELASANDYIKVLDGAGYFEVTTLTADDLSRGQMYLDNARRQQQQGQFSNYDDFLCSLGMVATIAPFEQLYISRIAQLANKTNQFNLTTRRYTEAQITAIASSADYIALYGKLTDKFGDNGLVSVIIGRKGGGKLEVELWLMSCRVLKRGLEYAMFDKLVQLAVQSNVETIIGYYYPTDKNTMVKEFYGELGFTKTNEVADGTSTWEYKTANHSTKNNVIKT